MDIGREREGDRTDIKIKRLIQKDGERERERERERDREREREGEH